MLLAGASAALRGQPARASSFNSFRALAARRGLIFGCATDPERLEQDLGFATLVQSQCAQVTAENVLKWLIVHPAPGKFDFSRADRLADWLSRRGMGLYGHCLVWHEALPAWLSQHLTPATAPGLLSEHIGTVVGRYRGRARAWDVVIEAVERADQRADGLRRSPWLEALGPDYIGRSFHLAHAADPAARLALADYGLEYDDIPWMVEKRRAILRLFEGLRAAGAPVHALNIQAHLLGDHPPTFGASFRAFLSEVADLGLDIFIGELDVDDQKTPGDAAQRDQIVADIYSRFLDTALQEPAVKMLSTWGLTDRYTAKTYIAPRPDGDMRPLPFDRDLHPKPAALAMAAALEAAPPRRPLDPAPWAGASGRGADNRA